MIALTGGLVIVGVAQAYILWRQTGIINQTLILTDRPKLIVRNLAISEPSQSSRINREPSEKPFRPEEKITGALWVVNPGNGDAHFQRGWCGVYNGQGLPMEVPYDSRVGFSPLNGSTIRPGERVELRFTGTGPSDDQVAAANAAPVQRRIGGNDPAPIPLDLYVLGWIDYRDDLGITRRTAFCRRYERTRDRFIAVKDRDYEYAD